MIVNLVIGAVLFRRGDHGGSMVILRRAASLNQMASGIGKRTPVTLHIVSTERRSVAPCLQTP